MRITGTVTMHLKAVSNTKFDFERKLNRKRNIPLHINTMITARVFFDLLNSISAFCINVSSYFEFQSILTSTRLLFWQEVSPFETKVLCHERCLLNLVNAIKCVKQQRSVRCVSLWLSRWQKTTNCELGFTISYLLLNISKLGVDQSMRIIQ